MLQYILTSLAGVALGIAGMRVWRMRAPAPPLADGSSAGGGAQIAATPASPAIPSSRYILYGAGGLAALAVAVFALRPGDGAPSNPVAMPGAAAGANKPLDDVDTMIGRLAARLEKNPTDGEGFRMLGWSYVMTGRPGEAVAAYKRALALLPRQANVQAGYGEALTGMAKGSVTQEAKDAFDKAIAADPAEPRARYFEALWLAQHGQEKQALGQWIALAKGAPADAPWQADLRRRIGETAARLKVAVPVRLASAPAVAPTAASGEPPALDSGTVQAASALPAADRQAMVDGMVEGLAKKLQADPKNADGWVRLLRSRMVLGQGEQAGRELAAARRALAGSAADLARIDAAAREFGVPGA